MAAGATPLPADASSTSTAIASARGSGVRTTITGAESACGNALPPSEIVRPRCQRVAWNFPLPEKSSHSSRLSSFSPRRTSAGSGWGSSVGLEMS
jgi:hypothetical protein